MLALDLVKLENVLKFGLQLFQICSRDFFANVDLRQSFFHVKEHFKSINQVFQNKFAVYQNLFLEVRLLLARSNIKQSIFAPRLSKHFLEILKCFLNSL